MGTIFTLENSVKTIITSALDDLITELGKDCRLVYPSRLSPCDNCVYDPVTLRSTNTYLAGGPIPFQDTTCPVCNGTSQKSDSQSEIIKFLCAFDPKAFFIPIPGLNIEKPFSYVQTKGFLVDVPKVKRAEHIVFQVAIEGIISNRYRLFKSPADVSNIIQGRYFVATWEQI